MGQDLAPLDMELNIKLADSLKIRGTKGSHSIVCDLRYSIAPHETSTSGMTKFAEKKRAPSRLVTASLLIWLKGIIEPVTMTVFERF